MRMNRDIGFFGLVMLLAEDDGSVCIDWRTNTNNMLSVSVSPTGEIAYAVRLSTGQTTHGTAAVKPEVFVVLKEVEATTNDSA